ncbi:MAG: LuxR C-terminal-related transcriptional regulator [Polyangiaceae bacterium]
MRGDPVAILEVCYSLNGDLQQWVDRLTQTLQPSFDAGLGVFCTGMYLTPEGPRHAFVATKGNTPENAAELLLLTQQTMPEPSEITTTFASSRFSTARGEMSPANLRRFEELARPVGVCDGAGIVFSDGTLGVLVAGMRPGRAQISVAERRMWSRVAIHLSHGLRLRRRIVDAPVAVLSPHGCVVHAEPEAQAPETRELLRRHVRNIEKARAKRQRSTPTEAVSLWQGLVDGRWSLVDRFEADGKRFVVALANPLATPEIARLSPKEAAVCQLAAEGFTNTSIAYALGSKPSTISTQLKQALRKLRLQSRSDLVRTWTLLTRRAPDVVPLAGIDERLICVQGATLEKPLQALTTAEREVARLAASGLSNREIGMRRGVSYRTVANQLQRIFDKLGVSTRTALPSVIEG